MSLQELLPGPNPARDDVQQTDLGYDVVSRYICNNWAEISAAQGSGAYPFDVVVIGAGMFGSYCAEKLYRHGGPSALRIVLLDAGAFLLQSHIQNLPQQLGARSAGRNISVDGMMRAAHKTSSGECPGSATSSFPALLIVSAEGRCSGAAGRHH